MRTCPVCHHQIESPFCHHCLEISPVSQLPRSLTSAPTRSSAYDILAQDSSKHYPEIGVVAFDSSATTLVAPALLDQVPKTFRATSVAWLFPNTNITAGLHEALKHRPNAIVLQTDGHHNTGAHPRTLIPRLQGIDMVTIGFGKHYDRAILEALASRPGWVYHVNQVKGALAKKISQTTSMLSQQVSMTGTRRIMLVLDVSPSMQPYYRELEESYAMTITSLHHLFRIA